MNDERLMNVLLAPHVSEKSTNVADAHNQVVFKVVTDATKPEIKAAVEKMFNVKVDAVRVTNHKGKVKRFAGRLGRRNHWKKAYVTLQPGSEIDFLGAE
ncbi:50S ribosomal protein L23 [Ectothiorhodospiraceae bacterium 2226]|nr:50S ribosomal protein L23 [Ectothiorhodospiraceae bacterium 2226]